jgi:hypothetical protein
LLPGAHPLCFHQGMARLPSIDLAVAALDLQLVRLLRSAMQPKVPQAVACPPSRPVVVQRLTPQPVKVQPIPVPAPPALVLYRTEVHVRPVEAPAGGQEPGATRTAPAEPLPPPWKQPVWERPIEPPPPIKVTVHRPDIISKGSLIDFFM